jgi:hypothetical protein
MNYKSRFHNDHGVVSVYYHPEDYKQFNESFIPFVMKQLSYVKLRCVTINCYNIPIDVDKIALLFRCEKLNIANVRNANIQTNRNSDHFTITNGENLVVTGCSDSFTLLGCTGVKYYGYVRGYVCVEECKNVEVNGEMDIFETYQLNDSRINITCDKRVKVEQCQNVVFERCSTPFLRIIQSDELSIDGAVQTADNIIINNSNYFIGGLSYTGNEIIERKYRVLPMFKEVLPSDLCLLINNIAYGGNFINGNVNL